MTDQDPLEALLKATGRRPAIPADRADRVRRAALAQWRREAVAIARQRRMRWGTWLVAAAVVVVAVGLGVRSLRPSIAPQVTGIRVDRVANSVWAHESSFAIFRSDAEIREGSIVPLGSAVTTGADARVALLTPTGHSLRLDGDTTLRVLSDRSFALARGAVYVESSVAPAVGQGSLRIATPMGTIEDHGTQFELRLDGDALALRVREGSVTLDTPAGRLAAGAGQAITLEASGRVVRSEANGTGEAWAWTEAIAPMMEIEGRTLSEFLRWVARERGVRLRFAGAGLAEKAPTIVLNGSIQGMTLDQATISVLTTCGLVHRWDGGTLVVGDGQARPRTP